MGPTSSSRALEAILPLISAGQPYEAHQKARTFATRYTKSGAHAVAIDVLFQSARELLKAGHAGSGTDLAILLLDSYDRASESVTDLSRGTSIITHILALVSKVVCLTSFRSGDTAHRVGGSLWCVAQEYRRQVHFVRFPRPIFLSSVEFAEVSPHHRWSAKHGSYPAGDPALLHYVGDLLYKGKRTMRP
jgi:hypothetical protein